MELSRKCQRIYPELSKAFALSQSNYEKYRIIPITIIEIRIHLRFKAYTFLTIQQVLYYVTVTVAQLVYSIFIGQALISRHGCDWFIGVTFHNQAKCTLYDDALCLFSISAMLVEFNKKIVMSLRIPLH